MKTVIKSVFVVLLLLVVGLTMVGILGCQFTADIYVSSGPESYFVYHMVGNQTHGVLSYPDYVVVRTRAFPAWVKVIGDSRQEIAIIPPFTEAFVDPYEELTAFIITSPMGIQPNSMVLEAFGQTTSQKEPWGFPLPFK